MDTKRVARLFKLDEAQKLCLSLLERTGTSSETIETLKNDIKEGVVQEVLANAIIDRLDEGELESFEALSGDEKVLKYLRIRDKADEIAAQAIEGHRLTISTKIVKDSLDNFKQLVNTDARLDAEMRKVLCNEIDTILNEEVLDDKTVKEIQARMLQSVTALMLQRASKKEPQVSPPESPPTPSSSKRDVLKILQERDLDN